MKNRSLYIVVALLLFTVHASVRAQTSMPTSQPNVITIFREDVKYGHNADHEKTEMGWPAAYAKAKAPGTYIALTSMTGPNEAWFMQPFASWKAFGDGLKFESDNAELSGELSRLSKADAEHVTAGRGVHLMSRADLSAGTFPNVGKIRFYDITWFRVRPGHEQEFERLAKVFQAGYKKAAPQASYRVYEVAAGMPGPTYAIFSSFQTIAELDKAAATGAAVMGTFSKADQDALQKFGADGMVNTETQRFAMNGPMSYVDQATIDQDPAFWRPKKPAPRKATP